MRRLVRYRDDDRSQSQIVGVILITAVVVISVSTTGAFYLSTQTEETDEPLFTVDGEFSRPNITLTHTSGESVPAGELRLVVRINGSQVVDPTFEERFAPGETWSVNVSEHATVSAGSVVGVTLYHLPSQSKRYTEEWLVEENGTATATPTPTPGSDTTAPAVTVDSPNGGETRQGGSTTTIKWTASDGDSGVDSIDVEYSIDGGSTWNTVVTGTANDGSEPWSVPTINSTNVLIRVMATDNAGNTANDTSDATFTVDSDDPTVESVSPNSSTPTETQSGEDVTVSWNTTDATAGVANVTVSIQNASTTIANTTETTANGSTNLTVPAGTADGNYSVGVEPVDQVGNNRSVESPDAVVVDGTSPAVTVDAPNGGETFRGGETTTIEWNASSGDYTIDSIDIEYSTDGGSTWSNVTIDTADDGSYTWTVPNNDTSNAEVRIIATDSEGNTGTDTSDDTFDIDSTPPSVTVDEPNGRETFRTGETAIIEWTATDTVTGVDSVDIAYSTDDGASWKSIATDLPNSGSYDWTVPAADSTDVLVRVTATDGVSNSRNDASDSTFTVIRTGIRSLSVSDLISGEAGQNQTISFTVVGDVAAGENVTVDLSDAQDMKGEGQGKVAQVSYLDSAVDSPDNGDTKFVTQSSNRTVINFTASTDIASGETVSFNITGVETAEDYSAEHPVVFDRSDAPENATTTFIVFQSGSRDIGGEVNEDVYTDGDVTVKDGGQVNGNVTSRGDITLNDGGTINGTVTSGGTITVNDGGAIDGDASSNGTVDLSGPIDGNLTTTGTVTLNDGGSVENLTTDGSVLIKDGGTAYGNVTSDGTVTINDGGTVKGDVFVDSADDIICKEGATINGQNCETYKEENY